MKIFAHRGYSAKFPENTPLSFRKAFEFGADGIELDVRTTSDDEIVVFHDDDLNRIFGIDDKVKNWTLHRLKELSISDQKIPTLEEVLQDVPKDKWVIVEIKDPDTYPRVVHIVENFDMLERTVFSSFDHDLIEKIHVENEDIKVALLIGERHRNVPIDELISRILSMRPHSVHIPKDAYIEFPKETISLMNLMRNNGIEIFVWNMNDIQTYEKMKDLIDAVITDEVELFVNHSRFSGEG